MPVERSRAVITNHDNNNNSNSPSSFSCSETDNKSCCQHSMRQLSGQLLHAYTGAACSDFSLALQLNRRCHVQLPALMSSTMSMTRSETRFDITTVINTSVCCMTDRRLDQVRVRIRSFFQTAATCRFCTNYFFSNTVMASLQSQEGHVGSHHKHSHRPCCIFAVGLHFYECIMYHINHT